MASAEHEPTKEVTPKKNDRVSSNPEPLPEWSTAFGTWGAWWEIHNYGFGSSFVVLAGFCVYCLMRLRLAKQSLTLTRYFTAVTGLLFVFSFTRALYLLLDPYEGHKYLNLPVVFVRIVFALGYPCLTSIFSLINFAFVEVNNVWLIVKRLQNMKFLSSVIATHFMVVLIIYIVVTFAPQLARLFILCQVILILWWALLVLAFLYSVWLVKSNEKTKVKYINRDSKTFETLEQNEEDSSTSDGSKRIVQISGLVALAGIVSVALELYSLFEVYDLYNLKESYVEAWQWWGYQTCTRVVELCLCSIVAYLIYPSTKRQRPKSSTFNSQTTCTVLNEGRKISRENRNLTNHIDSGKSHV